MGRTRRLHAQVVALFAAALTAREDRDEALRTALIHSQAADDLRETLGEIELLANGRGPTGAAVRLELIRDVLRDAGDDVPGEMFDGRAVEAVVVAGDRL